MYDTARNGGRRGKDLFVLVRVHVPMTVYDSKTRVSRQVTSHVWDHIVENHMRWRTKDAKLLYMTHRHLQEDTSLIIDAKDSDALSNFLLKHVATMDDVRGIWVINMANMRFFRLPKDRPRDFPRFTVTIDVLPKHLDKVFESISSLKPSQDIMINYITNTYQSFRASIMVSALARSRNHMEAFVDQCIRTLTGVEDAEVTYISRTMRLVTPEEWQKHIGPYLVAPGRERMKAIDVDDDSLIAGC